MGLEIPACAGMTLGRDALRRVRKEIECAPEVWQSVPIAVSTHFTCL